MVGLDRFLSLTRYSSSNISYTYSICPTRSLLYILSSSLLVKSIGFARLVLCGAPLVEWKLLVFVLYSRYVHR